MNNKKIIEDFENRRCYYDDAGNSFPYYLRHYLEAFGIECGYNMQHYVYKGEQLEVQANNDGVTFISPKNGMVAEVADTNTVRFFDKGNLKVIEEDNRDGITFVGNDHAYSVYAYGDMLGNVHIICIYGNHESEVVVRVGEEHFAPKEYIDELAGKINGNSIDKEDLKVLNVMVWDPRILDSVKKLMKVMAPDIETAYENKVKELKAFYGDQLQEQIKKMYAIQESAINDLTKFKDAYIREYCSKEDKGSKGRA